MQEEARLPTGAADPAGAGRDPDLKARPDPGRPVSLKVMPVVARISLER